LRVGGWTGWRLSHMPTDGQTDRRTACCIYNQRCLVTGIIPRDVLMDMG